MTTIKKPTALILGCIFLLQSCEDFVTISPPTKELSSEGVFTNDATATSAVVALYAYAWDFGYDVAFRTGLSSDELINLSDDVNQQQFFENDLSPDNFYIDVTWADFYQVILHANSILEGLEKSSGVSVSKKNQLEGEARFMRAFIFFQLYNLFGEVPLVTTSDYQKNATSSRSSAEDIKSLIIEDLKESEKLLSDDYVTVERVRVNRSAANALLARVYLYFNQWNLAEEEANKVINNSALYTLNTDLNSIYSLNNSEAILQFYPAQDFINTYEGFYFVPYIIGEFHPVSNTVLSPELINSFEPEDLRLLNWIGQYQLEGETYYFSFKAKIFTDENKYEYPTILRLSEQYLIRAEAKVHSENLAGALEDINVIRERAGLTKIIAGDQATILAAIEKERRVELFAEGHRWFDLKRTNRINDILGVKKSWVETDALYPIPEYELLNNPFLTQNAGY